MNSATTPNIEVDRLATASLSAGRLELVWLRGEGRGVLYVYGPASEAGFSQVFGTLEELREIARTRYPQAEIHEMPLDVVGVFA